MSSGLNGTQKNNSSEHNDEHEDMARDSEDDSRRREPSERDRLLPPRSDGYLDPDDPAVSYNQCSNKLK